MKIKGSIVLLGLILIFTKAYTQENHLKNLKQLTFGGDNAEAYFSPDGKFLSFQSNNKKIGRILREEKRIGVEKVETYIKFKKDIDILGKNLNNIVSKILKKKKIIHGYAASTKGNILLQYYNLNSKKIKFISDRNSQKFGLITPGTNIPIISEKKSRSLKPDYYLVLAWHCLMFTLLLPIRQNLLAPPLTMAGLP
jgi:dipeptidyl aminopeptidase/acylaminoacyl peptidase